MDSFSVEKTAIIAKPDELWQRAVRKRPLRPFFAAADAQMKRGNMV